MIAVGKLGDETAAGEAVSDSMIDVVAVGRQMIVDPEAAGKLLAGKGDEIVPCEECMNCLATIGRGEPMSCKVNKNLPAHPISDLKGITQ